MRVPNSILDHYYKKDLSNFHSVMINFYTLIHV